MPRLATTTLVALSLLTAAITTPGRAADATTRIAPEPLLPLDIPHDATTSAAATTDDGSWFVLAADQLPDTMQHTNHLAHFGPMVDGLNRYVLAGIDRAQASAPDGGGYFIGITADPPESPIGYPLALLGQPLLDPPRTTSYCSGSTYTAFIEALNRYHADQANTDPNHHPAALTPDRAEAMRMQEPDGGRREDSVKFWGHWNDDGFGTHYALVQYSQMGQAITPQQCRPGDFINISWTNRGGHSVIFLGWHLDEHGEKHMLYWSSQGSTHGMSDQLVPLSRIQHIKAVRLTAPQHLLTFPPNRPVDTKIPGDQINW